MGWLALLIATGALAGSACFAALRLPLVGALDRLVGAAVIAVAQMTVILIVAGAAIRSLDRWMITGLALACGAAVVVLVARATEPGPSIRQVPEWLRAHQPSRPLTRLTWAAVLAVAVFVVGVYQTIVAFVMPPYSWDGLLYHMTAVAEFVRAGEFHRTPLYLLANTYPLNGELTFLWSSSLLGSDLLVNLPQLGFAAIGGLAVASAARVLGVSRVGATIAGAIFFLTPNVITQMATNYVDVIATAGFAVGVAFLLRHFAAVLANPAGTAPVPARAAGLTYPAISGLAMGFTAGTKAAGLVYTLSVAVALAVMLVVARRRHLLSARRVTQTLAIWIIPVVALGSFWYVRTWVHYGSPTHPWSLEVAGATIFEGRDFAAHQNAFIAPPDIVADSVVSQVAQSWFEFPGIGSPGSYTYEQRLGGLGWQWPLLQLPAILLFAGLCIHRRRWFPVVGLLMPFTIALVLQPNPWWARFTLFLVMPGAIALVAVIEWLTRPGRLRWLVQGVTAAIVCVGVGMSSSVVTVTSETYSPRTILSLARRPDVPKTIPSLLFASFAWVDELPEGARIATDPREATPGVDGRADNPLVGGFYYAFFGPDFRYDVLAVKPSRSAPQRSTLRQVRRHGIEYIVAKRDLELDQIVARAPNRYRLVIETDGFRVYEVHGAARTARSRGSG